MAALLLKELLSILAVMLAVVIVLVGGLTYVFLRVDRHYDQQACEQFQEATHRQTSFVVYHWAEWDCMTPGSDGRLLPIDQLRDIP